MKHLNTFKLFESTNEVDDIINELEDILIDLKDDYWETAVDFIPKRWSSHINQDYILLLIKKKINKSGSRYSKDSIFKPSDINIYKRIINLYENYHMEICYPDPELSFNKRYFVGIWKEVDDMDLDDNSNILGMELKLFLNTTNLDQS